MLLASSVAPFLLPESTSGAPVGEEVGLRKTMFFFGKTILFELGGCPGAPKTVLIIVSKIDDDFLDFQAHFYSKTKPNMEIKWSPKGITNLLKI